MPSLRSQLATFVATRSPELGVRGLLAACDDAGFDLAEVIDLLADPYDHLDTDDAWMVEEAVYGSPGDLAYHLVEYAGARATTFATKSIALRDVDVMSRHAEVVASLAASQAIQDRRPLEVTLALIANAPSREEENMLGRIAAVYPLAALAESADAMTREQASLVGRALRQRTTPLHAYETLLGKVEPSCLLRALALFYEVQTTPAPEADAMLSAYAHVVRAEGKPLHAALEYAAKHGSPDWWLPILRAEGLRASEACLRLMETNMPAPQVAAKLSAAGYADGQVLNALLANGVGSHGSLSALQESGWNIEQMVRALAQRDVLLPEVRRHLHELGVPTTLQRSLLTHEWDADVIDLVLPGASKPLLERD